VPGRISTDYAPEGFFGRIDDKAGQNKLPCIYCELKLPDRFQSSFETFMVDDSRSVKLFWSSGSRNVFTGPNRSCIHVAPSASAAAFHCDRFDNSALACWILAKRLYLAA
jgi:hypothetical protein